jgi:hypothetical protein
MHSLFLLILLIPRRLLKLIPLSISQTHLIFHMFIYPPVTSQILSRRLSVTIPVTTRLVVDWEYLINGDKVERCLSERMNNNDNAKA